MDTQTDIHFWEHSVPRADRRTEITFRSSQTTSNEKPEHEYSKWTEQESRPVSGSVASRNDVPISLSCIPNQRFRPIFTSNLTQRLTKSCEVKKKVNGIKTNGVKIVKEFFSDFRRPVDPLTDETAKFPLEEHGLMPARTRLSVEREIKERIQRTHTHESGHRIYLRIRSRPYRVRPSCRFATIRNEHFPAIPTGPLWPTECHERAHPLSFPPFPLFFFLLFFSSRSWPTSWYVARTIAKWDGNGTVEFQNTGRNMYRRRRKKKGGDHYMKILRGRVTKRRGAILPRVTKHWRPVTSSLRRHRRHYANSFNLSR